MLHALRHRVGQWRWDMARWLTPRRTVHSRGVKFSLPCDNWITHYRWKTFNDKEPETLHWIDHHVNDGDILFDIGANIGLYSLYAALRHPRLQVYAFEPEYSNLHLLRDNVIANQLHDRISVFSTAMGSAVGLSALRIQDFTPGAALHTESRANIRYTKEGKPVVWSEGIVRVSLDYFCAEMQIMPQCIKMDVDGNEEEILRGAQTVLRSGAVRTLIMELLPTAPTCTTCARLLTDCGFTLLSLPAGQSNQVWIRS